MKSTVPDLSLIVPCYNEEPHLESSVDALVEVLDDTRYSYEVVFVDDGSRDATRDLIRRICARRLQCRYIFHPTNRGRGAAFKTGFAASQGRVTGFVDIDLEVHARYIPALVNLVESQGFDVATGYRHYLLSQTGGVHRHLLSWAYRGLCRLLLGLGVKDSETGCKFFNRATATDVVLRAASDGWFWDTEVMSRAALANLRIVEMPVLFLRRADKKSSVRLAHDTLEYLRELYRFRGTVGLSLHDRSPVYWTAVGYDLVMKLLNGRQYAQVYADVAALIPEGSSVVDLCAGTCRLYFDHLRARRCEYLALDFNGHFVMSARNHGANARLFDVLREEVPPADYVVMCSSFYHFHQRESEILEKMRRAARVGVIISEPVRNLSAHPVPVLAGLARRLTNPGAGDYDFRFNLDTFRAFAGKHAAARFIHPPGRRNAVVVFAADRTGCPETGAGLETGAGPAAEPAAG